VNCELGNMGKLVMYFMFSNFNCRFEEIFYAHC
jgi:hypothetical protein